MSGFETRTMARKNRKGLALNAMPPKAPEPSAGDSQIPGAIGNTNGSMDTLEIGVEFQLDLKTDEFVLLKELGAGNGGTVSKVMHPATKITMARKVYTRGKARGIELMCHVLLDHTRRSQRSSAKKHCARTAHYERLQLAEHCDLLRRISQRHGRCDNVHGVHGHWVRLLCR